MAPLVKEFRNFPELFDVVVCVTGQHKEMLQQVLEIFDIHPDYNLDIMRPGQDLYDVTSKILIGMRDVLEKVVPDVVFVHGDTTTSMSAALASFYKQIPVAHVEAGLRTNDIYSPWPEEMNRRITGRMAAYNFCPTDKSKMNLLKEGVKESSIYVTGNTVIDALYSVSDRIKADESLRIKLKKSLFSAGYDIPPETSKKIVLITGHRRENFGEGFLNICKALNQSAEKYPDVDFVYPMHMNPNVRNTIKNFFEENTVKPENLYFIEPPDYLTFVYLMNRSYLILTDSGGIQEEAPSLGKPVLVMRNTTERPEAVECGTVKLVGTDQVKIMEGISKLLDDEVYYESVSNIVNPYGTGNSCKKIVEVFK